MLVREAFHGGSVVKNPPVVKELQGMWVRPLAWAGALEGGTATHSSILCLKNPMDRGTWRATVHGVTKSRTRLK